MMPSRRLPSCSVPCARFALSTLTGLMLGTALPGLVTAAPLISRLTPPSEAPVSGEATPIIARFLPGQRFDLQATVQPQGGQAIGEIIFRVDGRVVEAPVARYTEGLARHLPAGSIVATVRAWSVRSPGVHTLSVEAVDEAGERSLAEGRFEVVAITRGERPVKNIIMLVGDGMGIAHRTAARIVAGGVSQGKARKLLAMDTFPVTGLVMTASLDSIVTDSSPGMSNYMTGNKAANNQEGVFPDDTLDPFDNPRVEYLAEYLKRTRGTALGVVTTADVFDATPAAMAVHTSNRGAGTGIVDQFFDDRELTGLQVLMGGGRKWFLPRQGDDRSASANGSHRATASDYVLPADLVRGWGAAPGRRDPERDLLGDMRQAGWRYAAERHELGEVRPGDRLLGLFALGNMNVALDKIDGRRAMARGEPPGVVGDFGIPASGERFTDQPMLEEMTEAALKALGGAKNGFLLLVEGASIDKQAHNMDSERWIVDTIEFDRAVAVARRFAERHPDTLVIVTADHETGGANVIGASRLSQAELVRRAASGQGASAGGSRHGVVGTYEKAGFPRYTLGADGYPLTMDVDRRVLIGYAADADRHEDWLTNPHPLRDPLQPFAGVPPLASYPAGPLDRDVASGLRLTGQVEDGVAVHTGSDVPLSAMGRGASLFSGVMDNTEVFFRLVQAINGLPAGARGAAR
jgi:alkaline phosphatase